MENKKYTDFNFIEKFDAWNQKQSQWIENVLTDDDLNKLVQTATESGKKLFDDPETTHLFAHEALAIQSEIHKALFSAYNLYAKDYFNEKKKLFALPSSEYSRIVCPENVDKILLKEKLTTAETAVLSAFKLQESIYYPTAADEKVAEDVQKFLNTVKQENK